MRPGPAVLLLVLSLVALVLWALRLRPPASQISPPERFGGFVGERAGGFVDGGRAPARPDRRLSPHLVVDTLNLVHWLLRDPKTPLSPELVAGAIRLAAPALTARFPGRVYFVVKDRESRLNGPEAHEVYRLASEKNGVYVAVAERYGADAPRGVPPSAEHSARGRDDFLLAFLADRLRCAALTEDRFRDFARFRATLQPFHFYEFAFWRFVPRRDFIRPEAPAFARLRAPRGIRFAEVLPGLQGTLDAPPDPGDLLPRRAAR